MNFFQRIKKYIKDTWHDPVWSNVIAAGIIFVLSTILITINYLQLITFLGNSSELNNTVVVIAVLLLIFFSFSFVWRLIEDIRKKKVAPNIVCIGTSVKIINFNDDKRCWEEDFEGVRAALIKFGNEPLHNKPKIGELTGVNARIEFYERAGTSAHIVDRGAWLDTRGSVWFRYGDTQNLLAVYRAKTLYAEDQQRHAEPLDDEFYKIRVRLIGDDQWTKYFYFELIVDENNSMSIREIEPF